MILKKLTNDHYIIVDDSKIQEGYMIYLLYGNTPSTKQGGIARCEFPDANNLGVLWKKITHSTQPLEYSSKIGKYWGRVQPIVLSEVKELIGEEDVKKKAYRFRRDYQDSFEGMNECIMNDAIHRQEGFIEGYNQALEDNKDRKWTDEDLIKACHLYSMGRNLDSIMQSIKQQATEWEVEIVEGKITLKKHTQ